MSVRHQEVLSNPEKFLSLCNNWEDGLTDPDFNPSSILNKLSDLLEANIKEHREINPDPFDCNKTALFYQGNDLKFMLETLTYSKIKLIKKLINDYFKDNLWPTRTEDNHNLNIAACRFFINFNLEIDFKFFVTESENNQIIQCLFLLAENSCELLNTYAVGLLASYIQTSKNTIDVKKNNQRLFPKIFNRLYHNVLFCEDNKINQNEKIFLQLNNDIVKIDNNSDSWSSSKNMPCKSSNNENPNMSDEGCSQNVENGIDNSLNESKDVCAICEETSSSLVITETNFNGWIEIYPLTLTAKSYFNLKYLYQITKLKENFSLTYEEKCLKLILKIIDSSDKVNAYLTCEALKYLNLFIIQQSNIVIELMVSEVSKKLLLIPKHSIKSTGVLMCFHRMLLFEEGMKKICQLSKSTLVDLVKYELWMLKHSSDFNIRYVLLFFKYTLGITVILNIFDDNEGLFEMIDVVKSLLITQTYSVTEHFCSTLERVLHCLKKYYVAHLNLKAEDASIKVHRESSMPNYSSYKCSQSEDLKKIERLSNSMSINSHWPPVDKFVKLNGLSIILTIVNDRIIPLDFAVNRYKMIKNALKIINICAIMPKVQLLLCEPLSQINTTNPPAKNVNTGMTILMKTEKINVFGEKYSAAKKSLLSIILTCVCAPLHWGKDSCNYRNETSIKQTHTTDKNAVIEKIRDCIRNNHGIMILLESITTDEYLIHDANEIRELACRALADLARNETVYKIISKWPVFNRDLLKKYLINHHAPCEQPEIVCPTLNLPDPCNRFDPIARTFLSKNFAMRFSKNIRSRRLDQKFIFSRFRPSLKFNSSENTHFLCCEFLKLNRIAVGTNAGEIRIINSFTLEDELLLKTPHTDIIHLECSNDEKLLVTSSKSRYTPISSAIWEIRDTSITQKYLLDEHYCKFSNDYPIKLLGTKNKIATIYDMETSKTILTLNPKHSNKYKRNRAVFNGTNALVLSDGVLWDVNTGKEIHKFEKLNMNLNGVFHPNGLEIISNSEVWDVRKFGLLRSVSDLYQCNVMFSKTGKGMYSYAFGDFYDDYLNSRSSFQSFDPFDYSTLTNVRTNYKVVEICCDKYDNKLAVIQTLNRADLLYNSHLEIFDIGMVKQFC